jgi:tRNA(Arg) A34 adenosine deaminase TadA
MISLPHTLINLLSLALPTYSHTNHLHARDASLQHLLAAPSLSINSIPFSTRAYWMRQANAALAALPPSSPCPFAAFGSVIVNHSSTDPSSLGDLICTGANSNSAAGNPTLHGEIAAINNCSEELQGPRFNLTPAEALAAFPSLSLYTNAESCPMCASAIRWAGFREYIYGTSIDTLIQAGWGQIRVSSLEIFEMSFDLPFQSRLMGNVLSNETDTFFKWQFDSEAECPIGCRRGEKGSCVKA